MNCRKPLGNLTKNTGGSRWKATCPPLSLPFRRSVKNRRTAADAQHVRNAIARFDQAWMTTERGFLTLFIDRFDAGRVLASKLWRFANRAGY